MADYGINKRFTRAKVPLGVLRGFYLGEPNKLSSLAPLLDVNTGAGWVAIKSGMAIVKESGPINGGASTALGFRSAIASDAASGVPIYIALKDYDALDVQASGKLVGLDCSDRFELQSGYYDASVVWLNNDPVTVGAGGVLTRALTGNTIIGYVTAIGNGTNSTIVTGGKTPSATDMKVVQFKTSQNGQKA